jgi:hypothetical protein
MMIKEQESPDKQKDNRESSSSKQQEDGRGKSAGTRASLERYQWAKGESGNPSGRTLKNKWFRDSLREFGAEKPLSNLNRAWDETGADSNRDALVQEVWKDATGSDKVLKYKAIRLLTDLDVIEPDTSS